MKVWALGMAAVVCVGATAAWGQTAPFKCAKPGTVVQNDDGTVFEAISQGPDYCRISFKNRAGETNQFDWFAPSATMSPAGSRSWIDQTKPQTLWPLVVGKKVSARFDGANVSGNNHGSWMFAWTVEKYERITTKAGTFDTFLVTRTQDAIGRSFKEKISLWYAPDLGLVVKQEEWTNEGKSNKREAVSIKGQ